MSSKKPMRKPSKKLQPRTYSFFDELMASPTDPTPVEKRTHQLTRMWGGLAAIEGGTNPNTDDWRVCSDAVNLLETIVQTLRLADDKEGLLPDAVQALAEAGKRHHAGQPIRLDGKGIKAVRAVLEDYADLLEQLPHRACIKAHRITEARIYGIHAGRTQPHDVEVIDL